jgi:O-antigen/teichoic acid export membrane protein
MRPLVSILIPAYNVEKWIAQTIASGWAQTWPSKEIIIVDDGSTDQTLSVARQFASKSIHVVSQPNRGAAAARNKAFSICQGEYIQWMDADDLLSPDKISSQMNVVEQLADKRKLISCGWGSFLCRPEKARFNRTGLWADLAPVEWLIRKMMENTWMQPGTWLASRELTEAAGPWDERLSLDDDGEYFCRVLLESSGVKFVGGPTVYYRVRGHGSLGSIDGSDKKLESAWLSMQLHVQYLRSIEDSARTRAASIQYLQNFLLNFYPERPDIAENAQQLAKSLGGKLDAPTLPSEFAWIQKMLGLRTAKAIERSYRCRKLAIRSALDNALFRWESAVGNFNNTPRRTQMAQKNTCEVGDAMDPLSRSSTATSAQADENGDQSQHLQTDHLLANLKNRAISSGFITGASQAIQFALTLGSTMVLARLLTPHDFGLLAMVWTVMSFLRVFKDAGLSTATVQREGITHTQVSNLFWVNVVVSGFISVLVAALAPLIAWFYREPLLVGITLCLSSTFLLAGLAAQHMALLNRQMRFKIIAFIQVGSVLAGVLAGVGMAWLNYGYWSLVWMNLTTSIVALFLTWAASSWRPQFFKRHSGTRSLLHFGANLTAGTFVYSLARGLDGILIGRFCGAVPLGLYSRASAILSRPLEQFMWPISMVFIPAFSRLQNRPERFRQSYLESYEAIALFSFLFTGMCFALADPLTLALLGPSWEKAAVIFAGFTFAALAFPLCTCVTWLFTCQGRGKDSFHANLVISAVIAGSFLAGLPFGPVGVAFAYSASCLLIHLPVYYWLAGRSGPVSTGDLWAGFLKHLPVWGVVAIVAWFVRAQVQNFSPLVQLTICVPVSLLAGMAFIFVYSPSRRTAGQMFFLLRELRQSAAAVEVASDQASREAKVADAVSEAAESAGAPNAEPTLKPN